jgi:large subunit ribosomal protein L10
VPLNREQKEVVVAEVAAVAKQAYSAVAAEYRGLSVAELTELRAKARAEGVYLRVVKNTLARRAVEDTDFACMQDGFKGPLVLAFSQQDPGSAARVIKDFAKGRDKKLVKKVSPSAASCCPRPNSKPSPRCRPTIRPSACSWLVMKAPIEKLARTINEAPASSCGRWRRSAMRRKRHKSAFLPL